MPHKTTEMRAALVNADQTLSETHTHTHTPMNKITEYIDAMPIAGRRKSGAAGHHPRRSSGAGCEHQTFAREDDSPQGSVKARLEQAWPDSLADGRSIKDDEGRDQLKAMPEAKRSSMFPTRGVPTR